MSANERSGGRGFLSKAVKGAAMIFAATAVVAIPSASAAAPIVYNNIPNPLPGNVASLGYEATGTSEFGGLVSLAGVNRDNPSLEVTMSSWGCETGSWNGGNCSSASGSNFTHRLKFDIYEVGANDEPGDLIGRVTRNVQMPYRPSANYNKCSGGDAGKWYYKSTGNCFNGKAFTRIVSLGSIELPDDVIVGIAYNTTHYGSSPIGEAAPCFTSSGGCPYDSLNVGLVGDPPSVGTQPNPDDAYLNSPLGGSYCDGGTGGTSTFRLDQGCWTGYQPALRIRASH